MHEKIVTIGPWTLGVLSGVITAAETFNEVMQSQDPPRDLTGIFFACIIQSGAERFRVPKIEDHGLEELRRRRVIPESAFLRKRITTIPPRENSGARLVNHVFRACLPDDYRSDRRKYQEVHRAEMFLLELFLAMENRTSMVSVLSLPDPKKLEKVMPPELLIPLRNLLVTIEPVALPLPLPQHTISSANIRRFHQIIDSDIFSSYRSGHTQLDLASIPTATSLGRISESAKMLLADYADAINLKRMTLSLVPITTKVIDTIFGKLPGVLAEYSGDILSRLLNDERRLVIYQFYPVFVELIQQMVLEAYEHDARLEAEQGIQEERE